MRRSLLVAAVAALVALATPLHAGGQDDLFEAVAARALSRSDLQPWQRTAYTLGLQSRRWATVHQTIYYPSEGFWRGKGTRWGYGCSESTLASNHLREGTFVWVVWRCGKCLMTQMRRVEDTGGLGNDRKAKEAGCAFWVDLWVPEVGWRGLVNNRAPRTAAVIENPLPSRHRSWKHKRTVAAVW